MKNRIAHLARKGGRRGGRRTATKAAPHRLARRRRRRANADPRSAGARDESKVKVNREKAKKKRKTLLWSLVGMNRGGSFGNAACLAAHRRVRLTRKTTTPNKSRPYGDGERDKERPSDDRRPVPVSSSENTTVEPGAAGRKGGGKGGWLETAALSSA